jgi:hypothetical protein
MALGLAANIGPGDAQQRLKRRRIPGTGGLDQGWIDAGDGSYPFGVD